MKLIPVRHRSIRDGMHWIWAAKTRFGKSEAVLTRVLLPAMKSGNTAILLVDQPGTLADKFLRHCDFWGHAGRVIFDKVSYSGKTVGYDYCPGSVNTDPRERIKENEVTRDWMKKKIIQRRGEKDVTKNPAIEEGLDMVLDLLLNQQTPKPLYWLLQVFNENSPEHKALCADYTGSKQLLVKLASWCKLSGQQQAMYPGSALRALRTYIDKQSVKERDGASFHAADFYNKNGIHILSGASDGNLSDDAFSTVASTAIYNFLKWVRENPETNSVLVVDEGQGSSLNDANLAKGFREDAKRGLSIHLCVQNLITFSPDPSVVMDCYDNSNHAFGLLSDESALKAAEDIAIPLLDPLKIKFTEDRIQNVIEDGWTTITKTSYHEKDGKETRVTSTHDQPITKHRQETIQIAHYKTYEEQIKEVQRAIMNLTPGHFLFRTSEGVTGQPVYVPMQRKPFVVKDTHACHQFADMKLQSCLLKILARPEYREPVIVEPPCEPEKEKGSITSPRKNARRGT